MSIGGQLSTRFSDNLLSLSESRSSCSKRHSKMSFLTLFSTRSMWYLETLRHWQSPLSSQKRENSRLGQAVLSLKIPQGQAVASSSKSQSKQQHPTRVDTIQVTKSSLLRKVNSTRTQNKNTSKSLRKSRRRQRPISEKGSANTSS